MTHAYGKRSGTRYKFAKGFRQAGAPNLSRTLTTYKRGEYVTIKADGSVQKGMPHGFYHGRTGIVFDVTKRAVGVEITKRVRNRILPKRLHVRIEHVKKSRCRDEFVKRRAENDRIRREAAAAGKKANLQVKRQIAGPSEAKLVVGAEIRDFSPIPFVESF